MNQDPTLQDDIRMDVQRESTPLIESNHAPQPQINVCYELFKTYVFNAAPAATSLVTGVYSAALACDEAAVLSSKTLAIVSICTSVFSIGSGCYLRCCSESNACLRGLQTSSTVLGLMGMGAGIWGAIELGNCL